MTNSNTVKLACAAIVAAAATLASPPATAATAVRQPNGAIRYYDDNGFDRGFAWCATLSGRNWGGRSDCSYFTYAQCQASLFPPGGYCQPNPWTQFATPAPAKPRRR